MKREEPWKSPRLFLYGKLRERSAGIKKRERIAARERGCFKILFSAREIERSVVMQAQILTKAIVKRHKRFTVRFGAREAITA